MNTKNPMRPFGELTYLGKVQRYRKLAKQALDAYGLGKACFRLIRMAGNVLFRVVESNIAFITQANDPYVEGRYLLRIHDSREQPTEAIELELAWLSAICREAHLPVPEPVPTLEGKLLQQVAIPGIPQKHDCSLLRWVKGRFVSNGIRPYHYRAQGRLMAQLHNHASRWEPPISQSKRSFDWAGLFREDAGAGIPNSEAWSLLPPRYLKPFEIIAKRTKRLMVEWGRSSDVYGLIHGDCGVDANVLFWKGEARAIDFDGSGFGYYMYDLSLALEHCWEEAAYPEYRDALLDGYSEFRSIRSEQSNYMDLFLAAFYVYMSLWTSAMDKVHPNSPNASKRRQRWQQRGMEFIKRFLADYR
jgi:Ser/Thr protein kinase RdoA (MazF antagonist)